MMAREAALSEAANGRSRRLMIHNKLFKRIDVEIRDLSLKSTPRRRGPAEILGIDETGATVKFQPQTIKVERFWAQKRVHAKDSGVGSGICSVENVV